MYDVAEKTIISLCLLKIVDADHVRKYVQLKCHWITEAFKGKAESTKAHITDRLKLQLDVQNISLLFSNLGL